MLNEPTEIWGVSDAAGVKHRKAIAESGGLDIAPVNPEPVESKSTVADGDDAASSSDTDIDATVIQRSGKEYAAPAWMGEISYDDYALLGEARWWDVENLDADVFFRHYAEDGWLSGGITLEWFRTWAWRNQCGLRDDDRVHWRRILRTYDVRFEKL